MASFEKAKKSLVNKLCKQDLTKLRLSEYSINYLNFLIGDIWETLGRYEQVIKAAISHTTENYASMTIVDYGGGTGLLALLAKELGFKSVIYNDIYKGSCDDVKELSQSCSLELDTVIHGDAKSVVDYLNSNSIKADKILNRKRVLPLKTADKQSI